MTTSPVAPPTVPSYVNWTVKRLLRSPLHSVMSKNTMLLNFTGRKSGNRYVAVVRYVRQHDSVLCYTDSKWWINLRGGAPVDVLIGGRTVHGVATAVEEPGLVAESLSEFLHVMPADSKYYGVRRDTHGAPVPGDIVAASERTKLIRISLDSTP
ncbi:nitroreductase/quinone reductase family protein [Nocardia wallacei]|uniref:nitroreductase/quinone reductase family protein n=1 Tax=Nocardia wallacei TaxID=480035 RepID=UPI00245397B7|nr:nitroreductase/quinone reductase family protein [Nocardia wallacei]